MQDARVVDIAPGQLELELCPQFLILRHIDSRGRGRGGRRLRHRRGGRQRSLKGVSGTAHYSMTSSSKTMVTDSVSAEASPALTVLASTLLHQALRRL